MHMPSNHCEVCDFLGQGVEFFYMTSPITLSKGTRGGNCNIYDLTVSKLVVLLCCREERKNFTHCMYTLPQQAPIPGRRDRICNVSIKIVMK